MLVMIARDVRAEDPSHPLSNHPAAAVVPARNRAFLFYALLCAGSVQFAVLGHFFRSDDFVHLYEILDHGYTHFAFTTHGGHLYFTRNTVFYLTYSLFGLESNAYYGLALFSHLLNVFLLYRVVEISSSRSGLALVASLLWGMSAVNQGSLGWYSVYGHVLVGSFLLWILYDMARIRYEGETLTGGKLLRWYLLLLGAATSFGIGIPTAMLGGLLAWSLLPEGAGRRRATIALSSLAVLVPCLYLFWMARSAGFLGGPESAAQLQSDLSFYSRPANWLSILSIWARMIAYGFSSLVLGPVPFATPAFAATGMLAGVSHTTVTQLSSGLCGALLLGIFAALWRASPVERRPLAAYGILMVAIYGAIALGRTAFFQQVGASPLAAAVQPRYHYVAPAIGVILLSLSAVRFPQLFGRAARVVAVLVLSGVALVDYSAARWLNRYELPRDAGVAYGDVVVAIEKEIFAEAPGSRVEIVNQGFPVIGFMNEESFAGWAAVYVLNFPEDEVEGRRVAFVERRQGPLRTIRLRGGDRLNGLVESPAQAREKRALEGSRVAPTPSPP